MTRIVIALSAHGFGHAAMTAPVIAALRARRPEISVVLATDVAPALLRERFGDVPVVPGLSGDLGLVMHHARAVNGSASWQAYQARHARWQALLATETRRLATLAPDLILSNINDLALDVAAELGVGAVGLGCLNWADLLAAYGPPNGSEQAGRAVLEAMRARYARADLFLCASPSMPMTWLPNRRDIGPIAAPGRADPGRLRAALGLGGATRLVLLALGGMASDLDLGRVAAIPGTRWLVTAPPPAGRADMIDVRAAPMAFPDLLASCDAAIFKPGYGSYVEAACAGIPVLGLPRSDWPENGVLERWMATHSRFRRIDDDDLYRPALADHLAALRDMTAPPAPTAEGGARAAEAILGLL